MSDTQEINPERILLTKIIQASPSEYGDIEDEIQEVTNDPCHQIVLDAMREYANLHCKKETEYLKSLLLESWQMWKDLAEAGELKIGPNYWVRYAEMKLKVEAITEK